MRYIGTLKRGVWHLNMTVLCFGKGGVVFLRWQRGVRPAMYAMHVVIIFYFKFRYLESSVARVQSKFEYLEHMVFADGREFQVCG